MLPSRPDVRLSSDASRTGWGAVCLDVRTGGPWTFSELALYINALELLAALKALVVKSFTSSLHDCSVEIQIDNTTAVSYINKLGGCKSKPLCDISLRIATWCEERNLFLFAIFVPGVLNTLADAESRRPVSSGDWKLSPLAFASIAETSVQVDLFASDWNKQSSKFAIWFPHPGAWKVDAFNLHWKGLNAYCFPPFNLIPLCLTKILQEEAELVLVTPYWPSQLWFPPVLELSIDTPLLLLPRPDLLTSPLGESNPLVLNDSIRLVARMLSGVTSKSAAFRKTLLPSSCPPLAQIHGLPTSPPGTLGEVGVVLGRRIPCLLETMMS